jgi:uncharacterized protein DUF4062
MSNVKYSIFVGSSKKDLPNVRAAVIKAILSAGHIPSGMELWAAGHTPTLPTIQRYLEQCDLHLIILGSRYGTIAADEISFTEWEYRVSIKDGRPIIAFVLERDEFETDLAESGNEEQAKVRAFREMLEHHAICRAFSKRNEDAIAADCINSINEAINSGGLRDAAGWIRASSEDGRRLREIEKNYFLRKLLDRFYRFSTLTKRLDKEPSEKKILGEAFWSIMLGRIKRHGFVNMFFESGSTLAYVADEFEKKVKETGESGVWKITTNNAIVLLQLLLYTHIDVVPRPAGAPEDYYGAMFDHMLLRNPENAPQIPRALFPHEKEAVQSTRHTLQASGRKRLYLSTASGLDLDHKDTHFRGPHVGSHPNMLFKRAIFSTGQPVVLFLTSPKLKKRFEIGRCFPVFGPDLPWDSVCREHKLAICIGYGLESAGSLETLSEEKNRIKNELRQLLEDFNFNYAELELDYGGVIIIANAGFEEILPRE